MASRSRAQSMNLELADPPDAEAPATSLNAALNRIPNARQLVIDAATEALKATKFYYSKEEGGMVHEPDYKTRLDAAKFLAAYLDGLPAQSVITYDATKPRAGAEESFDLDAELKRSPALRERMRIMIERAEKRALPA